MKQRCIIASPYRNTFSGPEFPIGVGPFVRIPRSTFHNLFGSYPVSNILYFSTSKAYMFTNVNDVLPNSKSFEDLDKVINAFSYYNCSRETGKNIAYWIDVGDMKTGVYRRFLDEYLNTKNLNYLYLIKKYLHLL